MQGPCVAPELEDVQLVIMLMEALSYLGVLISRGTVDYDHISTELTGLIQALGHAPIDWKRCV